MTPHTHTHTCTLTHTQTHACTHTPHLSLPFFRTGSVIADLTAELVNHTDAECILASTLRKVQLVGELGGAQVDIEPCEYELDGGGREEGGRWAAHRWI